MCYISEENIFGIGPTALPHRRHSADPSSKEKQLITLSNATKTDSKLKRDCFQKKEVREKNQLKMHQS